MTMLMHIVRHLLITDLASTSFLGVLHPGPSLCQAVSRPSLKWVG
jgi:hypothetical protein